MQEVDGAIWDDNYLSKGSFQMPALYDPNG